MMFRILTVFLIIASVNFFVTVPLLSSTEKRVKRFDDEILIELYLRKKHALARFDMDTVKSIYSKNLVAEIRALDGKHYQVGLPGTG